MSEHLFETTKEKKISEKLIKIWNLCSNLSVIKQLFAVFAGSIISKFIRPQWIFSCVENIGIMGNSGNGCHGYTQR